MEFVCFNNIKKMLDHKICSVIYIILLSSLSTRRRIRILLIREQNKAMFAQKRVTNVLLNITQPFINITNTGVPKNKTNLNINLLLKSRIISPGRTF